MGREFNIGITIMICAICHQRYADHEHHLFSNSKLNRKLYGSKPINDNRNKIHVCHVCHLNKPIPKYTEKQFCKIMGIEPRSKILRGKYEKGVM